MMHIVPAAKRKRDSTLMQHVLANRDDWMVRKRRHCSVYKLGQVCTGRQFTITFGACDRCEELPGYQPVCNKSRNAPLLGWALVFASCSAVWALVQQAQGHLSPVLRWHPRNATAHLPVGRVRGAGRHAKSRIGAARGGGGSIRRQACYGCMWHLRYG